MVREQPLFPGVVSLPRHLASFPWENPEALFGYQGFFLFPLLLVLNLEFLWLGLAGEEPWGLCWRQPGPVLLAIVFVI